MSASAMTRSAAPIRRRLAGRDLPAATPPPDIVDPPSPARTLGAADRCAIRHLPARRVRHNADARRVPRQLPSLARAPHPRPGSLWPRPNGPHRSTPDCSLAVCRGRLACWDSSARKACAAGTDEPSRARVRGRPSGITIALASGNPVYRAACAPLRAQRAPCPAPARISLRGLLIALLVAAAHRHRGHHAGQPHRRPRFLVASRPGSP